MSSRDDDYLSTTINLKKGLFFADLTNFKRISSFFLSCMKSKFTIARKIVVIEKSLKGAKLSFVLTTYIWRILKKLGAKFRGKKGGFKNDAEESEVKTRGKAMIERVIKNPGPIAQKIVRLKESHNGMPPNFFLSDEENIILCGVIDWLEYVERDDSIRILDFKTGKHDEGEDSLQLPIYLLLLNALQNRKVSGASYWYLDRNDKPVDMTLPDINEARKKVLAITLQVKEAREKKTFSCPRGEGGCFSCKPLEAILKGEANYIGVGDRGQDIYFL